MIMYLRHVLQRSPSGVQLIAEAPITKEVFDIFRTRYLIDSSAHMDLETEVYWFNPGNPPIPVFRDTPEDWRGYVMHPSKAMGMVNTKFDTSWTLKYKPGD